MSAHEYAQLVARLGERFTQIDQRFDALRAEMLGHFDEVYRRLERLGAL